VLYRGFPSKLHHEVPHWVETGALFHIRIAIDREKEQRQLIDVPLAQALLDSIRFYETKQRWYITLFLLMPDHLHALVSFASDESMSSIIGDWKTGRGSLSALRKLDRAVVAAATSMLNNVGEAEWISIARRSGRSTYTCSGGFFLARSSSR
jgi:REP element-mobilizing transposase RayT